MSGTVVILSGFSTNHGCFLVYCSWADDCQDLTPPQWLLIEVDNTWTSRFAGISKQLLLLKTWLAKPYHLLPVWLLFILLFLLWWHCSHFQEVVLVAWVINGLVGLAWNFECLCTAIPSCSISGDHTGGNPKFLRVHYILSLNQTLNSSYYPTVFRKAIHDS